MWMLITKDDEAKCYSSIPDSVSLSSLTIYAAKGNGTEPRESKALDKLSCCFHGLWEARPSSNIMVLQWYNSKGNS